MDRALVPRVDRNSETRNQIWRFPKKKTHRRFDSRNRPRRFPAPRSRVLTVRFAQVARERASSTQKAGKSTPSGTVRRVSRTCFCHTRRHRDAVVSGKSNEHEPRDARSARRGGVPPARDAPRGRNTPRRALAVGAEITRIPAPDGVCGAPGCDVQDARAVRRGGGEDGHHARRRRRVPPLASVGTRASRFPARASRETRKPVAFTVPETSHSAHENRDPRCREKLPKGRAADARGRAARREARRAESRVTFCVSRGDWLCLAVPRYGPARTARAARRHRIGRIRPFPVRERRGEVPVGLTVEATVSAGCRGHFSR